jgi:thymidine kinase
MEIKENPTKNKLTHILGEIGSGKTQELIELSKRYNNSLFVSTEDKVDFLIKKGVCVEKTTIKTGFNSMKELMNYIVNNKNKYDAIFLDNVFLLSVFGDNGKNYDTKNILDKTYLKTILLYIKEIFKISNVDVFYTQNIMCEDITKIQIKNQYVLGFKLKPLEKLLKLGFEKVKRRDCIIFFKDNGIIFGLDKIGTTIWLKPLEKLSLDDYEFEDQNGVKYKKEWLIKI